MSSSEYLGMSAVNKSEYLGMSAVRKSEYVGISQEVDIFTTSSSEYVGMSVRKSHYVIVRIRGHVSSKEVRIRGHITVTAHLYYVIVRIRGHVSKEVTLCHRQNTWACQQ